MSLGLKKSTLTRTINASRKLPSGAGIFPLVTCGNHSQSLYAEKFACGHRKYICTRQFYSVKGKKSSVTAALIRSC